MSTTDVPSIEEAVAESWSELLGTDGNPEPEGTDEPEEATDPDEDDPEDESDELEEPDEGDDEDEELDDESEDDLDDEDDDEDAETDPTVIELSEDDTIRLPDGTEVPVKDAVLFQQGFTKKTQELAEQRKELEEKQELADEAIARYDEVAERYQTDPVGLVRDLVVATQDPTYTVALLIKSAADEGVLDPAFVEAYGLKRPDSVNSKVADQGAIDQRLARIEQGLEQQTTAQQADQRRQELIEHYTGQWREIKDAHGLQFKSPTEERETWRAVAKYAHDHEIVDLRVAYRSMKFEELQSGQQEPVTKDPAVAKRKSAQRKVARRSKGGTTPAPKQDEGPRDLDEVLREEVRAALAGKS